MLLNEQEVFTCSAIIKVRIQIYIRIEQLMLRRLMRGLLEMQS
jgi:hypothetical protein